MSFRSQERDTIELAPRHGVNSDAEKGQGSKTDDGTAVMTDGVWGEGGEGTVNYRSLGWSVSPLPRAFR